VDAGAVHRIEIEIAGLQRRRDDDPAHREHRRQPDDVAPLHQKRPSTVSPTCCVPTAGATATWPLSSRPSHQYRKPAPTAATPAPMNITFAIVDSPSISLRSWS